MTLPWKNLRQDVLAEFAEIDRAAPRRFELGSLTVVLHGYLRPRPEVLDTERALRELELEREARLVRERREAREHASQEERRRSKHRRMSEAAYQRKLVLDAAGKRRRRAERAAARGRVCKLGACGKLLAPTRTTRNRYYCDETCRGRARAERRRKR